MKLREAAVRRKEVNRGKKETRLVNAAPEPGRSERGAEAIAEARASQELTRVVSFYYDGFVRKRLNQYTKYGRVRAVFLLLSE